MITPFCRLLVLIHVSRTRALRLRAEPYANDIELFLVNCACGNSIAFRDEILLAAT